MAWVRLLTLGVSPQGSQGLYESPHNVLEAGPGLGRNKGLEKHIEVETLVSGVHGQAGGYAQGAQGDLGRLQNLFRAQVGQVGMGLVIQVQGG